MIVDEYGRVALSADDLFDVLYRTGEIDPDLLAEPSGDVQAYNDLCRLNDKPEALLPLLEELEISPEEEHRIRQDRWFIPLSYSNIDVWERLRAKCGNDRELARLEEERVEYEKRDLLPLLRLMIFLVDEFRHRKVVWGVGRGSSVASFALYLIGITKINPMQYGLSISEFLRD